MSRRGRRLGHQAYLVADDGPPPVGEEGGQEEGDRKHEGKFGWLVRGVDRCVVEGGIYPTVDGDSKDHAK